MRVQNPQSVLMRMLPGRKPASFVSSLLPPLAAEITQKSWRRTVRGIGFHTFEGCYPHLSDVQADGYDDDDLVRSIVANRTQPWLNYNPISPPDAFGDTILPLIVSRQSGKFTVIDFGGGMGIGLLNILKLVTAKKFEFVIVETPAMARAVRETLPRLVTERMGDSSFLKIETELPSKVDGALIAHLGGVIHCISDWRGTMAKIAALKPATIIVAQTPFSDLPTYARRQLNMPHRRIASWVLNKSEFLAHIDMLGYRPVYAISHAHNLTHWKAPGPSTMESMVFE